MEKYGQMSSSSYFSVALTLFFLIIVCLLPSLCNLDSLGSYIVIGFVILAIVILIIIGLYHYPLSVTLDSDRFYINYIIHSKKIQLSNIISVSRFFDKKSLIPIFGSYGFFGWWGLYYTSKIGKFKLTASNISELVTLMLNDGKVLVISCNDADDLVRQIKRHLAL